MPSKTPSKREIVRAIAATLCVAAAGCAHLNDPFRDSSHAIDDEMTTASAENYRAAPEFRTLVVRGSPPAQVCYENGSVTHWPLWFEDPFEDKGNDVTPPGECDVIDNHFAWNGADYLHILYGPGRFIINAVGAPISAIVRPPGLLMESDGRISRGIIWCDHDAKVSDSACREPPDYNQLDTGHVARDHDAGPAAPADHESTIEIEGGSAEDLPPTP